MATLQLIWNGRAYDMWSWTMGTVHQSARTMRHIRNNIYITHIGPRGTQPSHVVIAKMARGDQEMHSLSREAEFYENELKHLQGTVVPRSLGFFRGKECGIDVGCLLLEYCSGFMAITHHEKEEENRQMMLAACKIHQAGIVHGALGDGHHFVKMGDNVRVVDFSLAVRHRCTNGTPILNSSHFWTSNPVPQCPELALMEKTRGYRGDRDAARHR